MGAAQQCGFHTAVVIGIMRSLAFAALSSSPMTNLLCGPCRQTTLLTDKLTFRRGDASHKHPDINQLKRTDVNKCSKNHRYPNRCSSRLSAFSDNDFFCAGEISRKLFLKSKNTREHAQSERKYRLLTKAGLIVVKSQVMSDSVFFYASPDANLIFAA